MNTIYYGFHADYVNKNMRHQINQTSCWAAAIEKATDLIGKPLRQEDIIGKYVLNNGANVFK